MFASAHDQTDLQLVEPVTTDARYTASQLADLPSDELNALVYDATHPDNAAAITEHQNRSSKEARRLEAEARVKAYWKAPVVAALQAVPKYAALTALMVGLPALWLVASLLGWVAPWATIALPIVAGLIVGLATVVTAQLSIHKDAAWAAEGDLEGSAEHNYAVRTARAWLVRKGKLCGFNAFWFVVTMTVLATALTLPGSLAMVTGDADMVGGYLVSLVACVVSICFLDEVHRPGRV